MLTTSQPVTLSHKQRRSFRATLPTLLILLLAWGLRLWNLGAQSFWNDEGFSIYLAQQDWRTMTWGELFHPPLHTYLLHFWLPLGLDEWVVRFSSVVLGTLTVGAVYALGCRTVGLRAALLGTLWAATSPFLIHFSQETRPHIAGAAFGWLGLAALTGLVTRDGSRRQRWRDAAGYAVWTVAGCLSLYLVGILAAVAGVWVLGGRRLRTLSVSQAQGGAWLVATVSAVVSLGVWVAVTLRLALPIFQARGPAFGMQPAALSEVLGRTWLAWTVGPTPSAVPVSWLAHPSGWIFLVLFIVALLRLGFAPAARRWRVLLLVGVMGALPLALWLVDQRIPSFEPRFVLIAAPALYLLAAWGAQGVAEWFGARGRRGMVSAVTAAVGMMLIVAWGPPLQLGWYDAAYARDDYRGLVEAIALEAAPGDALVLDAPWQGGIVDHYAARSALPLPTYPLPAELPLDGTGTAARLSEVLAQHSGVWLVLYGQASVDPQNFVEGWLDTHARRRTERWFGGVRLVRYDLPLNPPPAPTLNVALGPLTLTGFEAAAVPADGGGMALRLGWQLRALEDLQQAPYHLSLRLLDELDQEWGRNEAALIHAGEFVEPGRPFVLAPRLTVPAGTSAGTYRLQVVLSDRAGFVGEITLGGLAVTEPSPLPALAPLRRRLPLRLDRAWGSTTLIGAYQDPATVPPPRPGATYPYDLLWLLREPTPTSIWVALVDEGGTVLVQTEHPAPAAAAPRLLRTLGSLTLPFAAEGRTVTLQVSVGGAAGISPGGQRVVYWNSWAQPLPLPLPAGHGVTLATAHVPGRDRLFQPPPAPGQPSGARFGANVELLGVRVEERSAEQVRLTLTWRALAPAEGEWKVFVHLVDAQGTIVAQSDQVPLGGAALPASWQAGEILLDTHTIGGPLTGPLSLRVGWYNPATGERWPALSNTGEPLGNSVTFEGFLP